MCWGAISLCLAVIRPLGSPAGSRLFPLYKDLCICLDLAQEIGRDVKHRHRPAIEIALELVAGESGDDAGLMAGFDTLGGDFHT